MYLVYHDKYTSVGQGHEAGAAAAILGQGQGTEALDVPGHHIILDDPATEDTEEFLEPFPANLWYTSHIALLRRIVRTKICAMLNQADNLFNLLFILETNLFLFKIWQLIFLTSSV